MRINDLAKTLLSQEVAEVTPGLDAFVSNQLFPDQPNRPGNGPPGLNQVERKLRRGFLKADRRDLARMVGTDAMDTWIGQESGWDPTAVSPANNQGLPNGGLFQFWYGHDFSNPWEGSKFTMPIAKQAKMAATQFNLTPARIREFARQIRNGTYKGWG